MLRLDGPLEEYRASIRARAEARIAPLIPGIDRTGTFSTALWAELRDAEIFALPFAEADGGLGGSFLAFVVAIEELARVGAIAGLYPGTTVQVAGTIVEHGTDTQRKRWLPVLLGGEGPASWAFTEPGTGSDPKQIDTTARRLPNGEWSLSGQKLFISYAGAALVALVFARVEDGGLSAFLVETDRPGYSVGPAFEVLGLGGGGAAPVYLDEVRLPEDAVLGAPGKGFDVMLAGEAQGKIRASAINVGIASRAVEEAGRYALGRLHRGVAIADKFPTIQTLLGEMEAEVLASRSYVRAVAQMIDDGHSDVAREAKFFEVTQGVVELQKTIVARSVLAELRA